MYRQGSDKKDKFIPLSIPNLKGNELKYVTQAIKTEWVSTGGPYVSDFENKIAEYVSSRGAVSCQNGTSGLHVALMVCGVSKEDEVIVPTLTFIAAVNPVKYIGAEPIFMDCDDSLCMDANKLLEFCLNECSFIDGKLINNHTKKHIKAIIVVHVFGNMANMEKIMKTAERFNLKVIEDATEALGTYYTDGQYKGKYAGTIGTVGIYSFNGNKIITTGGGGMIVSDNEELLNQAKHLTTQAKSDELYYTHDEIGYNYRMTNLQAALGLAQLEQLEDFIGIKEDNYNLYKEAINEIQGLSILDFEENIRSNYWFYALKCNDSFPLNRDEIIEYLSSKGIQSRPIWGLINEQKPYIVSQSYKIEKAKHYIERIVNIPCSSSLSDEEVRYVIECLKIINLE
ncbi:MAG: LegC family aminotransferase [Tissierella sp.]|nr:LegC family aminotransferase [Tissierella sp.]